MKNRIKQIIGWLLCTALIISALYVPMSFSASATTNNYYIKYGGTGDGRTSDAPAPSVVAVVASINADGWVEGDTVYINIIAADEGNQSNANGATPVHTIVPYIRSGVDTGNITHSATVVIRGNDGTAQYIAYSSAINKELNIIGPTVFKTCKIFTASANYSSGDSYCIYANGNDVSFESDVVFYRRTGTSGGFTTLIQPHFALTKYTANQGSDIEKPQTVTIKPEIGGWDPGEFHIASDGYDACKHTEDVKIVIDNASTGSQNTFRMRFGGINSNSTTHIFEKNLNIDVKKATKISIVAGTGNQKIQVNGGLQIITDAATNYNGNVGGSYNELTNNAKIDNTSVWALNVPAADRDKVDFTETTGTFSIAEGYTAIATNKSTSETVKSSGGLLTIPSGDWNISFASYYVQYGGTGDGRSADTPARSVKTAIASLNADGLGAGDIANIYVLSSSGVSSGSHTLTPWGTSGDPEQTHTADIVVQGYGGKQWLAYGSNMNSNLNMSGPTTFTNIKLFSTSENTGSGGQGFLRAYGYNLTFGEGFEGYRLAGSTTYATCPLVVFTRNTNNSEAYDITTEQTFIYKCAGERLGYVFVASENYDNRRHKEDVNAILDHADIGKENAFRFVFGGYNDNTSTHVFEKNFNIDVRNAKNVGFKSSAAGTQKVQVNGALQIITNPSTLYHVIGGSVGNTDAYTAIQEIGSIVSTTKSNIRVLTVNPEDRDKIDFTATAGQYSVDPDYRAVATNNSSGAVVKSVGDIITLPAGDWTLEFTKFYKAHSLVLRDSIGLNFFVDLSTLSEAEKTSSYMTFEISNGASKTAAYNSEFTGASSGSYGFTCPLSSVQMAETVTPTFHYGDVAVAGAGYSVKEYVDYVKKNSGSFNIYTVSLVNAIANYGYHAQQYFSAKKTFTPLSSEYSTTYTADGITSRKDALADKAITATGITNGTGSGRKFQYNLNFDTTTSVLIKFYTGDVSFTSVKKDGVNYENRRNAYTENDCTLYLLYIPISQLGDAITVKGKANTKNFTIVISGLSHTYAVLNSDTTTAQSKNVACALYDYYEAAINFISEIELDPSLNAQYVG